MKLSALDLLIISDTIARTLSISGFEGALGGYSKKARELAHEKLYYIMESMEVEIVTEKPEPITLTADTGL